MADDRIHTLRLIAVSGCVSCSCVSFCACLICSTVLPALLFCLDHHIYKYSTDWVSLLDHDLSRAHIVVRALMVCPPIVTERVMGKHHLMASCGPFCMFGQIWVKLGTWWRGGKAQETSKSGNEISLSEPEVRRFPQWATHGNACVG